MPVPSTMSDLSTTAGSNSPAGTEAIGTNLDNYLRAQAALIRQGDALASASIAAASTVDVSASDGQSVSITGAATINSLGTGFNGCLRELRFSGACTLTHSASLALPNAANITTAAGDVLTFRCTGSGVWALVSRGRIVSGDVTAALGYTPVNKAGDTMSGALSVRSGTVSTQQIMQSIGWNNGVQRWAWVLEANGEAALYSYNSMGGSPTLTLRISTSIAGGSDFAQLFGQTMWHGGNQLALGTTAAGGRSALGLGTWATKGQTVSTADPSGTPADGDVWLKYTP